MSARDRENLSFYQPQTKFGLFADALGNPVNITKIDFGVPLETKGTFIEVALHTFAFSGSICNVARNLGNNHIYTEDSKLLALVPDGAYTPSKLWKTILDIKTERGYEGDVKCRSQGIDAFGGPQTNAGLSLKCILANVKRCPKAKEFLTLREPSEDNKVLKIVPNGTCSNINVCLNRIQGITDDDMVIGKCPSPKTMTGSILFQPPVLGYRTTSTNYLDSLEIVLLDDYRRPITIPPEITTIPFVEISVRAQRS